MGGLSKKAYQLQELRSTLGDTFLTLDAGGLLFESAALNANQAEQEKITAEGIVTAYNLMGYEAVGIAPNDLAAGLAYLSGLQKKSQFRWLSANLVKIDGSPLFTPYLIRKLPDITCAVIGLTGSEVASQLQGETGAQLLPWQDILPQLVGKLADQSDFIVLLSSLDSRENIEVARKFPEVRLIIEATGGSTNKSPVIFRQTLLTSTTRQGKYLGSLEIDWQPSSVWRQEDPRVELEGKRAALDRIQWQQRKMEERGKPEELYEKEPEKLASYRRLMDKKAKLEPEIAALEEQVRAEASPPALSTFSASFIALETSMPDQPEVLSVVTAIKDKIAAAGRQKSAAIINQGITILGGDPRQAGFAGWQRCAGCHVEISEAWRATPHARAFDTLVDKGQQFNQDCLSCHVTGIISGDEPYILTLPEDMLQVGCEACHGPGMAHVADSTLPLSQQPVPSVCLRCHTPDQDDSFIYGEKSKLVH